MIRSDLDRLISEVESGGDDVCLTVTLPTHRHAPENAQDPIRLKGLVRDAKQAVEKAGFVRDVAVNLSERLDSLDVEVGRQVGWDKTDFGLVCYVSPSGTHVVSLSHAPDERVVLASVFSFASLVKDVTTADDVHVIALSGGGNDTDGTQLYHLVRGVLTEHRDDVLPASFERRDRETRFSQQRLESGKRDALHGNFLREVDNHILSLFGNPHSKAIVLVGIERLRSTWNAVASEVNRKAVVTEVDGNVDKSTESEIVGLVTDSLEAHWSGVAADAVEAVKEKAGTKRVACGVDDALELARSGRVHRLVVEDGFTDEVEVDGVIIGDRVSKAIRACYDTSAEIVVVPEGALEEFGRVAAEVRW